MNYITNDMGKFIVAEGNNISPIRMKTQYPKLIDKISSLHLQNYSYGSYVHDDIINAIIDAGIESKAQVESIIYVVLNKLNKNFDGWKMKEIPQMFLNKKLDKI